MSTVAETIRDLSKKHLLENRGLLCGQCLSAVGWVGGTVPELSESQGIIELPTSDVANSGFVTGLALAGRRPIYIIRYQGFLWYNAATIVNYAAKSKELWNTPCPMFVRALAMEGGIGPVAGNYHHSFLLRMPGVKVYAPMTPKEYEYVWHEFITNDDVVICSEHRSSFHINYEIPNILDDRANIIIFAIGAARLNAVKAIEILNNKGIYCNLINLVKLGPKTNINDLSSLKNVKLGLIIEGDYEEYSAAESWAYYLNYLYNIPIEIMGLEHKTAGFSKTTDNLTPSIDRIINFILCHYN